jgi:hypothetical protein
MLVAGLKGEKITFDGGGSRSSREVVLGLNGGGRGYGL